MGNLLCDCCCCGYDKSTKAPVDVVYSSYRTRLSKQDVIAQMFSLKRVFQVPKFEKSLILAKLEPHEMDTDLKRALERTVDYIETEFAKYVLNIQEF